MSFSIQQARRMRAEGKDVEFGAGCSGARPSEDGRHDRAKANTG